MKILAIDQGTTSTRAFLLDTKGGFTPLASLPHRQIHPAPGWVEHDAEELLANVRACLDAAADIPDIVAVGLANQGESCLAWDADSGRAIGNVIVWQDDRTAPETDRLRADGLEPVVKARAGLPLDAYFSATKLAWLLRERPEAQALHARGKLRLGTTDAFFRDRLTGRFETDVTTASRTSLMNLAVCGWDDELCRIFAVPRAALPAITASSGSLGSVRIGGRAVPFTTSIVDQQAALFGHGCRQPGDSKITFGTGAFALALTGGLVSGTVSAALPTVAWQVEGQPPTYALDGGVYAASAAVNWAQGLGLIDDLTGISHFDRPPASLRGTVFVPALAGLACPHWNRAARGAWMGLSLDTTREDMAQALLEGVAFRMAEVIADMERAVPLSAPVSIDGGMSANPWFCQFLADCLGRELLVSDEPELTALGTGLLAAEGIGQPIRHKRRGRRLSPRPLPEAARQAFRRAREAVEGFSLGV